MRVLFITNKVKTYNKGFHNDFEPLINLGHSIYWAANFAGFLDDKSKVPAVLIDLPINSNPLNIGNYNAYKELIRFTISEKIDVIICSTPIGGMLGRLVAKKTKTKVIYAAHGLLFFKGAPLINNTVYKLQEVIMAKWTDVIITINNEDYSSMDRIKKKEGCKLYLVHGAGVDVDDSCMADFSISKKRTDLCIPADSKLISSIGFLNKNKNNRVVIKALRFLKDKYDIHYVICGEGKEEKHLINLAKKNGVGNRVHFLGFRTDVYEIIKASDLVIVPSFREGVPRVVLEAMNLGVPCIGSDTRGIRELIGMSFSKFLCNPHSPLEYASSISYAFENDDYCKKAISRNFEEAKKYTSSVVMHELAEIYKNNI